MRSSARCVSFFATVTGAKSNRQDTMIEYREATRSDIATIVDFQVRLAAESEELDLDAAVCTRGVTALFDDPSRGRYFLAASGGEVIASLMTTYEWSDWRNGMVWWIQSVYVRPAVLAQRVYGAIDGHVKGLVDATDS